ncbi:MAG: c-type cytochrome [Pseudomonadota bacterium]|nr:c-type cytochrome [Pseudomonadota bacterium]
MNGHDFNQLMAAVLIAGVLAVFAGFVADLLIEPKMPSTNAYLIDIPEGMATAGPIGPESVAGLFTEADIERGRKLAKMCTGCHTVGKDGPDRYGPNLWNIAGAKVAVRSGFTYSDALKAWGGQWDTGRLNLFLYDPRTAIPATRMSFLGLRRTEERAAVIAWLQGLTDASQGEETP